MIGSSMPASVTTPKNRMAKTNMPTTGGQALDAGEDELARVEPEPADQRRRDRNEDERDQRRHPLGHDDREQHDDRHEAKQGQHRLLPEA